jgi:hypothetical protein
MLDHAYAPTLRKAEHEQHQVVAMPEQPWMLPPLLVVLAFNQHRDFMMPRTRNNGENSILFRNTSRA